jgi:hypothetical protein
MSKNRNVDASPAYFSAMPSQTAGRRSSGDREDRRPDSLEHHRVTLDVTLRRWRHARVLHLPEQNRELDRCGA